MDELPYVVRSQRLA